MTTSSNTLFSPQENEISHVLSKFTVALVSTLTMNQAKNVICEFESKTFFKTTFLHKLVHKIDVKLQTTPFG